MTVSVQTSQNTYTGNGSTTVFAYTFRIIEEADLVVYLDDVEQSSGYTVSGVGNNNGGNVTFSVPPGSDVEVDLVRQMDLDRTADYAEGGGLASEDLDDDFDRVVMMVQDLNRDAFFKAIGTDNYDFDGARLSDVGTPTENTDAVTKVYVDGRVYRVKTNASDGSPNYLENKISGGSNISVTESAGVLTVAVTTSGLDADTVDGSHASAFAAAGHNHDASYSASGHDHDSDYYTQAQVDSSLTGKSDIGHTHDDRYYTESEIDSSLADKSDTGHTHIKSNITDFTEDDYVHIAGTETITGAKTFDLQLRLKEFDITGSPSQEPSTPASGYGIIFVGNDNKLYFKNDGGVLTNLIDVVSDTTPQLGGPLDVNGKKITSASDGDIDIEPDGTGNVLIGNFEFDADQSVGAGQDNYVLTYDSGTGSISLESAGSGDVVKIASGSVHSAASLELTGLSSTYYLYELVLTNILPATNNQGLWLRVSTDNGSTWKSGASDYWWQSGYVQNNFEYAIQYGDEYDSEIVLGGIFGTTAGGKGVVSLRIFDPSATSDYTRVTYGWTSYTSYPYQISGFSGGFYRATTAVDAIQLLFSSGNIAWMNYALYGYKA